VRALGRRQDFLRGHLVPLLAAPRDGVVLELGLLALLHVRSRHVHPQASEQDVQSFRPQGPVQVLVGDQMDQFLLGEALQHLVWSHLERHRETVLEP